MSRSTSSRPRLFSLLPVLLLALSLVLSSAQASPSSKRHQKVLSSDPGLKSKPGSPHARTYKVAIIGAGPGGTSAAYFLHKAQEILEKQGRGNEGFDITVFEREQRVGGRTAIVHPFDDEELDPVELGASIFVDANRNLQRAAKDFGLDASAHLGEDGSMGIWDGQQFLFEGNQASWWTSARFLWRYGYAFSSSQKIVKKFVTNFLQLYDPSWLHKPASGADEPFKTSSGFPWKDMNDIADAMQLSDAASKNAEDFFVKDNGIAKIFVEEIIEGATLVNYGQDVYSISGVGASASLATSGAVGVKGGNKLIFEQFLGRSGARLRMGSSGQVTGLVKFANAAEAVKVGRLSAEEAAEQGFDLSPANATASAAVDSPVWWLGTSSGFGALYDYVLIATPWHNSGITLMNTHAEVPSFEYVRLHVTLLVTNSSQPNPVYFGRGSQDEVPTLVLTSRETLRKAGKQDGTAHKGGIKARVGLAGAKALRAPNLEFNSLNYLAKIERKGGIPPGGAEEHVVKIFSEAKLSDSKLERIMGSSTIGWVHRQVWDAYPRLRPTSALPSLRPDEGLFYLNAFERLISTMETATVSARNAVGLLLEETLGGEFVHGGTGCPWEKGEGKVKVRGGKGGKRDVEKDEDEEEEQDWAGWGCKSG